MMYDWLRVLRSMKEKQTTCNNGNSEKSPQNFCEEFVSLYKLFIVDYNN